MTVPNPSYADSRMTDNEDYRAGYVAGYLDAARVAAERNDDQGFADRFLAKMRQQRTPAEQLVDEAAARLAAEHQAWLERITQEDAR